MDLDKCIETVLKCQLLKEKELKYLCKIAQNILLEENNLQPVQSPVIICGDIHGQFYDLLELFKTGGEISDNTYIFMGDYVDRGYHSLEVLTLLLLYKVKYPKNIILIRGNHETRAITLTYGFYQECIKKYGSAQVWKYCCEVFDCFVLAALVDSKILCLHGGLSPEIKLIEQYRLIDRFKEPPAEGAFADLMWSDPDERLDTWRVSERGAGHLFGEKVVKEFNFLNGLDLICRSHQLVQEGYQYYFEKKMVNVWSAPNYCYRCGNLASILKLDEKLNREFKIFTESTHENIEIKSAYFL